MSGPLSYADAVEVLIKQFPKNSLKPNSELQRFTENLVIVALKVARLHLLSKKRTDKDIECQILCASENVKSSASKEILTNPIRLLSSVRRSAETYLQAELLSQNFVDFLTFVEDSKLVCETISSHFTINALIGDSPGSYLRKSSKV